MPRHPSRTTSNSTVLPLLTECVGGLPGWGCGGSVCLGLEAGQEGTDAELELVVGGDPGQLRGQLDGVGKLARREGGALATAATGRINDAGSALLGGLIAGAVIGTGQWLVARRLLDPRTWIPATAVAMSIGLAVGAWVVGYGHDRQDDLHVR
jgi:hypothetical protein